MNNEIKLEIDHGNAKAGEIFVQGLHGVPDFEDYKNFQAENFYWKKGSKKSDNRFLMDKWIKPNPNA